MMVQVCAATSIHVMTSLTAGHNWQSTSESEPAMLYCAEGSQAGDVVFLENSAPSESYPKQLKSDIWKKIVAEFKVMQGVACCANQKLNTQHGLITLPHDIPDEAGIH